MTTNFSVALQHAKDGGFIQRTGWNGQGLKVGITKKHDTTYQMDFMFMQFPTDHRTYPGKVVPWLASQLDVLADDWVLL